MIAQLRTFLLEKANSWELPSNGAWSYVFWNSYDLQNNGFEESVIMLLWFLNREPFPGIVCKLSQESSVLKREFKNLSYVHQRCPDCVPRPLELWLQDDFSTLWMKGVPGRHGRSRGSYPPAPETVRLMADLLASVHRKLRINLGEPTPLRYAKVVVEPLQSLLQFGPSDAIQIGCKELMQRISPALFYQLPVIPQHGDMHIGNVLRHGKQRYIVDWQSFGTIDLPFYDLFTLLLSALRFSDYPPEQCAPSVVRQVPMLVERYCRALDLPVSFLRWLLPLTLANWCHLEWPGLNRRTPRFKDHAYWLAQHYFEQPNLWESVFLGKRV